MIVALLVLNAASAVVFSAVSRGTVAGLGYDISFAVLVGSAVFGLVCTFLGARRLTSDRERAFQRLQLAVLAFLLLTRVFEFAYNQLSATLGLLVDLLLLGVIGAELHRLRRQPSESSRDPHRVGPAE